MTRKTTAGTSKSAGRKTNESKKAQSGSKRSSVDHADESTNFLSEEAARAAVGDHRADDVETDGTRLQHRNDAGDLDEETLSKDAPYNRTYGRQDSHPK